MWDWLAKYDWIVFAALAALLIILGRNSTASVAAGSAFVGIAGTRFVDIRREHTGTIARAEQREMEAQSLAEAREHEERIRTRIRDHDDLDNTRRVSYMALLAANTAHVEIAATVINALVHHSELATSFDEAKNHVIPVVRGDTNGDHSRWLLDKIQEIDARLAAMDGTAEKFDEGSAPGDAPTTC